MKTQKMLYKMPTELIRNLPANLIYFHGFKSVALIGYCLYEELASHGVTNAESAVTSTTIIATIPIPQAMSQIFVTC